MPFLMGVTSTVYGTAAAPTAGQTIASIVPSASPNQIYQIQVACYVTGTPTPATDNDNFGIVGISTAAGGSNPVVVLCNSASSIPSIYTINVQSNGVGSAQFAVRAIRTATAGTTYSVSLSVTPLMNAEFEE